MDMYTYTYTYMCMYLELKKCPNYWVRLYTYHFQSIYPFTCCTQRITNRNQPQKDLWVWPDKRTAKAEAASRQVQLMANITCSHYESVCVQVELCLCFRCKNNAILDNKNSNESSRASSINVHQIHFQLHVVCFKLWLYTKVNKVTCAYVCMCRCGLGCVRLCRMWPRLSKVFPGSSLSLSL